MLSCRAKKDGRIAGSGAKPLPSVLQDSVGSHIMVTCGSISGSLYLSKLDESKKPLPKCILVSGNWYSPSEFQSLAGKKTKKWKQSLHHLDKPLSEYVLSCSLDQQGDHHYCC